MSVFALCINMLQAKFMFLILDCWVIGGVHLSADDSFPNLSCCYFCLTKNVLGHHHDENPGYRLSDWLTQAIDRLSDWGLQLLSSLFPSYHSAPVLAALIQNDAARKFCCLFWTGKFHVACSRSHSWAFRNTCIMYVPVVLSVLLPFISSSHRY